MKVITLIEKLEEYNPDYEVRLDIPDSDYLDIDFVEVAKNVVLLVGGQ